MTDYASRLLIPLVCQDADRDLQFWTHSGLVVAFGYQRVVIGKRGPYIEFSPEQIRKESLQIPDGAEWRYKPGSLAFYGEWRSRDRYCVKFYDQFKTVDYADYKVGMWYVSPFDLMTIRHSVLIKPLSEVEIQAEEGLLD